VRATGERSEPNTQEKKRGTWREHQVQTKAREWKGKMIVPAEKTTDKQTDRDKKANHWRRGLCARNSLDHFLF
jgi:hypothetical protein